MDGDFYVAYEMRKDDGEVVHGFYMRDNAIRQHFGTHEEALTAARSLQKFMQPHTRSFVVKVMQQVTTWPDKRDLAAIRRRGTGR